MSATVDAKEDATQLSYAYNYYDPANNDFWELQPLPAEIGGDNLFVHPITQLVVTYDRWGLAPIVVGMMVENDKIGQATAELLKWAIQCDLMIQSAELISQFFGRLPSYSLAQPKRKSKRSRDFFIDDELRHDLYLIDEHDREHLTPVPRRSRRRSSG